MDTPRLSSHDLAPRSAAPSADLLSSAWLTVDDNRLRLHRDGRSAFPAMLKAVEEAREEIAVEMYWFAADRVGTLARDALARAARRGVRVRIIYDSFGSFQTPQSFWTPLLREPTAEIRLFGSLAPWNVGLHLSGAFRRNHRKIIVVDGAHTFVGGLNIGEEWWPQDGSLPWRDDVLELLGPASGEARALFWRSWCRLGGSAPAGATRVTGAVHGRVWLIANDRSISSRRQIRRTYLDAIRRAHRRIDIANAYFLPDQTIYRALVEARLRGVPVRIILPERSDVPHMGLAQRALIPRMLCDGIQPCAYQPVVFHSKTAVIDDFVTVGSYNLDHRSWRSNLECNVAIRDAAFADAVAESVNNDLRECRPFRAEDHQAQPLLLRALGTFFLRCRRLL